MNLLDIISKTDLDRALADKLITIRDDGAGLRILNYSDAALYTPGAWDNPAVRTCRGVIVDDSWHIVARPWVKFFNHGQAEAGALDLTAPVEVTDKLDGSLGIIHRALDGQLRVATRGSFESDQAIHATEVLRSRYPDLWAVGQITPLAEIVYPANRIVVDYGDLDDLVLLGGVDIETGRYYSPGVAAVAIGWAGPTTTSFPHATLQEALAAPPRPGMEGLCVRYVHHDQIVKIKQDDYVRLHRIVTGLSERSVWEHMCAGRRLEGLLGELPDELHQWTRDVWDQLDDAATSLFGRALQAHQQIVDALPDGWARRDYAEQAKLWAPLTPYLFQILDERDPRPAILKTLKPAGDTRAKAISEAIA